MGETTHYEAERSKMRDRQVIENSGAVKELLLLEVLLDIRNLLSPKEEITQEAPLYISDKPPKPKKKKKIGGI